MLVLITTLYCNFVLAAINTHWGLAVFVVVMIAFAWVCRPCRLRPGFWFMAQTRVNPATIDRRLIEPADPKLVRTRNNYFYSKLNLQTFYRGILLLELTNADRLRHPLLFCSNDGSENLLWRLRTRGETNVKISWFGQRSRDKLWCHPPWTSRSLNDRPKLNLFLCTVKLCFWPK